MNGVVEYKHRRIIQRWFDNLGSIVRRGMQGDGYNEYPNEDGNKELIHNLRLDDSIRKVKLTLDERMLRIEQQYGVTVDINIHHIARLQHHSSHLIPLWTFVPALVSIWAGMRIVTDVLLQLGLVLFGASFIVGRFMTSKPTLTIQTHDLDGYSLYGNDAELLRLINLLRRLQDGQTLEQARLGLEMLERGDSIAVPVVAPTTLEPSTSIGAFLDEELTEEPHDNFLPDWNPLEADEPRPDVHYPDDHKPQPVAGPVLVPTSWQMPTHPTSVHIPMYQAEQPHISALQTPHGFIPSYITGNQVHIPQYHQEEQSEPEIPDFEEDILEAELFDFEEEVEQPQHVQPQQQPVLRPRIRRDEDQQLLRKKVRRQPTKKTRGARAFFGTMGRTLRNSRAFLSNRSSTHAGTNFQSPSTAARLHQRSQDNARDAMEQLSSELPNDVMNQINDRISRRREVMNSLQNENRDDLDSMSFGELQATSPREHIRIRSIDEISE